MEGNVVAQFNENEIMELIVEQLEGEIPPQRFARLKDILAENTEALTYYVNILALHTNLAMMWDKSKKPDLTAPLKRSIGIL